MLLYDIANFTTAVPTANYSSSNGRVCRTFQVSDPAICESSQCVTSVPAVHMCYFSYRPISPLPTCGLRVRTT